MPTSLLEQWPLILRLLRDSPAPVTRVLDVGPGCGKAAVLLREYVPSVQTIDAIEAEPSYVERHSLRQLYGTVHVGRFETADPHQLAGYDALLMVDVIEHMPMGPALDQLRAFRGQVLLCTPQFYEEAWRPGMPQSERHLSLWGIGDFAATGHPVWTCRLQHEGYVVHLGPRGG